MKRIYFGGTYDILHAGHIYQFKLAKELFPDSEIIVALNTDEFIKEYKGHYPIFSYDERYRYLISVEYIDKVIPNSSGADSTPTILEVNPDIIMIGNDWLQRDYPKQMNFDSQWLTDHKITLIFLPLLDGLSNTEIKKRVKA